MTNRLLRYRDSQSDVEGVYPEHLARHFPNLELVEDEVAEEALVDEETAPTPGKADS